MNLLKSLLAPALFAAATLTATAGVAQSQVDHSKMDMSQGLADGEVRKVDKDAAKVTIKHGAIKNLDMPPMSMVFRVREAKMLDGVAVGNRVRFVAEKVNGQYLLTTLTKAP